MPSWRQKSVETNETVREVILKKCATSEIQWGKNRELWGDKKET